MRFTLACSALLHIVNRPGNFARSFHLYSHRRLNMSTMNSTYEEAIVALNSLQSNAMYIQKARSERNHNPAVNIIRTKKHLNSLGIKIQDLNSLNIIHISGTKGKGSTCALTESILRHHGAKTGFYSSPHLIFVNERIRINGQPLPKTSFASYFWHVYNTLQENLEDNEKMPSYFMFLTVMAFYVFMKEKVDAAIIEVGIGGLYDCTNIIEKPVAVGVTALGLDHVQLLGNTIELIARQKAGIFKFSIPAFTVPQPESALTVLRNQSQIIGCPLYIVPPTEMYQPETEALNLTELGMAQNLNASLAIQLSNVWLSKELDHGISHNSTTKTHTTIPDHKWIGSNVCGIPSASHFKLSPLFVKGITACSWPGRFHTVKKDKVTFFLDGAHTNQSIKHCVHWFQEVSSREKAEISGNLCRVLLFNCTGQRAVETLLDPLSDVHFDFVLFSPNRIKEEQDSSSDQCNLTVNSLVEMNKCQVNSDMWCHMMRSYHENAIVNTTQTLNSHPYTDPENSRIFPCLEHAIKWILEKGDGDSLHKVSEHADHFQVLVTGSLHLVGGVLSLIEATESSNS